MSKYLPEFQKSLDSVLRIDPSLKPIVESHVFPAFLHPKPSLLSSFEYLARGVISQQVSGAAARSIRQKFMKRCGSETEFPGPERVLDFNVEQLREAGLSRQKATYVLGLARAYQNGEVSDELFQSLDDDEVVDKVVSLHGFGPWSAQMFLIFYLHRMNVFSPADVGIQRGMRRYLKQRPDLLKEASGLEEPPLSPGKSKKARAKQPIPPDLVHMDRIAHKFSPHRTAFQMILWKLSDIQMDTVEGRNADDEKEREQAQAKRHKINSPVEQYTESKDEANIDVPVEKETTSDINGITDHVGSNSIETRVKDETKYNSSDAGDDKKEGTRRACRTRVKTTNPRGRGAKRQRT